MPLFAQASNVELYYVTCMVKENLSKQNALPSFGRLITICSTQTVEQNNDNFLFTLIFMYLSQLSSSGLPHLRFSEHFRKKFSHWS